MHGFRMQYQFVPSVKLGATILDITSVFRLAPMLGLLMTFEISLPPEWPGVAATWDCTDQWHKMSISNMILQWLNTVEDCFRFTV